MVDAHRSSLANVNPLPHSLQRHHRLQLFAAEARLGADGPHEVFLVMKLQHRAFITGWARRDAVGAYRWGGVAGRSPTSSSSTLSSALTVDKGPLHEWVIDAASVPRREIVRVHVFAAEESEEASSIHASDVEERSDDEDQTQVGEDKRSLDGSADTPRAKDEPRADAESTSPVQGVQSCSLGPLKMDRASSPSGTCIGIFEVPLTSLQSGMCAITGGPRLSAPAAPYGAASPGLASIDETVKLPGSLKLRLAWESRGAFLQESRALSRRTEELCGILSGLSGGVEHLPQSSDALNAFCPQPSTVQDRQQLKRKAQRDEADLHGEQSPCWPPRLPARSRPFVPPPPQAPSWLRDRGISTSGSKSDLAVQPKASPPRSRRADRAKVPLSTMVAEQQGRIDSLKELLANTQPSQAESTHRASSCPQRLLEGDDAQSPQASPQVYCGTWRVGRNAATAVSRGHGERCSSPPGRRLGRRHGRSMHTCSGRGPLSQQSRGKTPAPGAELVGEAGGSQDTNPWLSCGPGSEVERFIREHAHMRLGKDLLLSSI